MKRLLLGGVALATLSAAPATAADVPVRAAYKAAAPAVTMYNWSGFFIGGNVGYGWGRSTDPLISFVDPAVFGFADFFSVSGNGFPNLKPAGVIGGGQIGYNWQTNSFVLGVVADFQAADINDSVTVIFTPTGSAISATESLSQKLDFLGTVRARAGVAFDNFLVYGTGGYAYGHVKSSLGFAAAGATFSGSASENRSGWTAGVGAEYGVGSWSLGVEYLHYDLGHSSVTAFAVPPGISLPGVSLSADQRLAGDIVRATLNYRFGYGPVVAKY